MPEKITKKIVVPVDGSEKSLKSLDYLRLMFGPEHDLEITLLYILPTMPPILEEEREKDPGLARKLKAVEEKNVKLAESILSQAKAGLLEKGFKESRVGTVYRKKESGVAKDICNWSESKRMDAIMISTRGRTRMQEFFMGEVSRSVMEYCPETPIWMLEPVVRKKGVLVCVDSSGNALKAVDHAGFMLSGTDCPVVLFHTKRQLSRFVPSEILKDDPELEEIWKNVDAEKVAPFLVKAEEMLLSAGIEKARIRTKIVDGTRSAASDIKRAANRYDCGTVVVGRRGLTGIKELVTGSVTRKLLEDISGMAVWIVG
jgi:nucleotide-binding universal stress UspA family protein